MMSCASTVVATATFFGELPVSVIDTSGVCPALSAPLAPAIVCVERLFFTWPGLSPAAARGLARLGLGLDHLAHVRRVGREPLERRGSGVRLPEVERRRGLVHLVAAEREDVADDQPGDEAESRQPPAREQRVPVLAEIDLALVVQVGEVGSFPGGGHGRQP